MSKEFKRRINGRKFGAWEELPGGRRFPIKMKAVTAGQLAIHEKYPDDKGHKKIIEDKT